MARTRGGTKVPRAKLKAVPSAALRAGQDASDSEEDNKAGDDSFDARKEADGEILPLHQFVLCFSAIEEGRSELMATAKNLGAKVEGALTTEVTHLVTTSINSLKTKAARQYGISVMQPSWLTALHAQFVSGEVVDIFGITESHRVPALAGLSIAITGFPIPPHSDIRSKIAGQITQNGAQYKATFDRHCTHLLCGPEITPHNAGDNKKIALARTFAQRSPTAPLVVWSEWLDHSLNIFYGAADEATYLVEAGKPRPDPTDVPKIKTCGSSQQLLRQETMAAAAEPAIPMQGVLTSTPGRAKSTLPVTFGGIDQPEVTKRRKLNRVGSQQHVVAQLLGLADALPVAPVRPSLSDSQRSSESASHPDLGARPDKPKLTSLRSTSSFSAVPRPFQNSFRAEDSARPSQSRSRALPLQKQATVICEVDVEMDIPPPLHVDDSGVGLPSPPNKRPLAATEPTWEPSPEVEQIFAGLTIALVGMSTVDKAVKAIRMHGGRVVEDWRAQDGDEPDWICCPWSNPPDHLDLDNPKVVSQHWLERCVYLEELVDDRESHVACKPVRHGKYPADCDVRVCCTGFDEFTKTWMAMAGGKAGIKFTQSVQPGITSDVVCESETGAKYKKAKSFYIPTHGLDWFLQLIREAPPEEKPPAPILDGVVIAFSSRFSGTPQRNAMVAQAEAMGARIQNHDITHFIHTSKKQKDQVKEFKLAKEAGQYIVHPKWLDQCEKQQERVDERAFPHTYQDDRALAYDVSASAATLAPPVRRRTTGSSSTEPAFSRTVTVEPQDMQVDVVEVVAPALEGRPFEPIIPIEVDTVAKSSNTVVPSQRTIKGMSGSQISPPVVSDAAAADAAEAFPEAAPFEPSIEPPSQQRSTSPLREHPSAGNVSDLNTQYLDHFKTIAAKTASSDPASPADVKGKKRRRRLSRGQNDSGVTNAGDLDANGYIVTERSRTRTAWEMTQAGALLGGEAEETPAHEAQTLHIAVVDPAATKAKERLLKGGR